MAKSRICLICGKEYEKNKKYSLTQWASSKYCGYICGAKAKKLNASLKPIEYKICIFCEKKYSKNYNLSTTQWRKSQFCSRDCAGNYKRIYKNNKDKNEAYRRRCGKLIKGSKEEREKISRLTKLAMQRPEVQEKIRQPREALSLEHRIKLSNVHAGKMPKNMMCINNNYNCYSNIQRGEYDINGTTIFFRSKWEANYALYLDFLVDRKQILKWEFEPDTFMFEKIKLGTKSYTPDFKVFNMNGTFEYHEVKGYMDSRSKTKLKRFKKYYPKEKLVLINSKEYNLIKRQIGKMCKFY